jgi:D-beta-D-heptose 7-phosphate kinase/D-beta-D-heptose 1-phosphate adenosyltransferase
MIGCQTLVTNHSIHADIERLSAVTVLCLGDVMLDRFVYGRVMRISPEAPIPVLQVHEERTMLGGAGNAVRTLSSLGANVCFMSVAGADAEGDIIVRLLEELPGGEHMLSRDKGRRTSVKTRFIADGQQLLRADTESVEPLAPKVFERLMSQFAGGLDKCDIVLLSDYAKGVLSGVYAVQFIDAAKRAGKPVVVDPKGRDFRRYRGATVVKPNLREFIEVTGIHDPDEHAIETGGRELLEQCGFEYLLVTRGAAGMMLVSSNSAALKFPSVARELYDVSGAGDTVAAVLAAGMGAGLPIERAVELANLAASVAVGKIGTAVVDRSEIAREADAVTRPLQ